jgi:Flp pilus assembly protein CpaB
LALLLAGVALSRGGQRPSLPVRLVPVVFTVRPITAGHRLSAPDLTLRRVPAANSSPHHLSTLRAAVGRIAAVGLPPGSPVMDAELATQAATPGRDVAVRLDDLVGVPAESMAGVRADVYLTRPGRSPVIQRVLSGVLVVAASRTTDGAVATLRLAPRQVSQAIQAEGLGQLRLVALPTGLR